MLMNRIFFTTGVFCNNITPELPVNGISARYYPGFIVWFFDESALFVDEWMMAWKG